MHSRVMSWSWLMCPGPPVCAAHWPKVYEKSAIKRLINDIERRVTFDSWKRSARNDVETSSSTARIINAVQRMKAFSLVFMASNILYTCFQCWNFILAGIFIALLFKRGLCLEHKNVNNSIDKPGTEHSLAQLVVWQHLLHFLHSAVNVLFSFCWLLNFS